MGKEVIVKIGDDNVSVTAEQMKAVTTLNLCTVSISQIVDYQDLYIMEQEYEAILNNLNLENIQKDEEIRQVLNKILNVITFFKIQDGDKKLIDKKHQHRLKNAIWSATPQVSLALITGAAINPIGAAISLASQIGIGYMNYRKEKANLALGYEEDMWKLQRAAIEQLNGLRRELFNAAWKLAKTYEFPDSLRLTERQIKKYNAALMENNLIRKYECLNALKEEFNAYPYFWYQLAHAAYDIYINSNPALVNCSDDERSRLGAETLVTFSNHFSDDEKEDIRNYYRNLAKEYYTKFSILNDEPLLRTDQIACANALEYADILLEDKANKRTIKSEIDKAVLLSGKEPDILQLCVISYMRIGENEAAAQILEYLINNEYNVEMNSQMLSSVYVNIYLNSSDLSKKTEAKSKYGLLENKVDCVECLIPWKDDRIEDKNKLSDEILDQKQSIVVSKYYSVLQILGERYEIKLNQLIPLPGKNKDSFYLRINNDERLGRIRHIYSASASRGEFKRKISGQNIDIPFIDIINEYYVLLTELECLRIENIKEEVERRLSTVGPKISEIQHSISANSFNEAEYQDFIIAVCDIVSLFEKKEKEIFSLIKYFVDVRKTDEITNDDKINVLSELESELYSFCNKHELPEPRISKTHSDMREHKGAYVDTKPFKYSVLGKDEEQIQRELRLKKMVQIVEHHIAESNMASSNVLSKDSVPFNRYFDTDKLRHLRSYKKDTILIIDDTSRENHDLLFTDNGIISVQKNEKKGNLIPYKEIRYNENEHEIYCEQRFKYTFKKVDLEWVYSLIQKLKDCKIEEL